MPPTGPADALLRLLTPFWQLVLVAVIGVFVLGALARLARRGKSRMNTALVVTGAGVVGLMVLGALMSHSG